MKTYKQIISEASEMQKADDMTIKELKIACNSAQNILDMIEDGEEIQRWQVSAIVKASEELASVYASMNANIMEEKDTHTTKDGKTAKKGLWFNINQRKKKGLAPKKPVDDGYPDSLDIDESSVLGPKGSIHKSASVDQSDKEYIKQKQFKQKWEKDNPNKAWPGYTKAGFK